MPNKFRANLLPDKILAKASDGKLKVDLLAVAVGTELPVVDDNGKPMFYDDGTLMTFTATEEVLRDAVKRFSGGIFNANHRLDQKIGGSNQAYFLDGFACKGEVVCPEWSNKIKSDTYTGVSAEGTINFKTGTVDITGVAFLDDEYELGGACPKDVCKVKNFAGGKALSETEAAGGGSSVINTDTATIDPTKVQTTPPMDDEMSFEAKWSPNYDAYWAYIEDENGKISSTKANQIFLKKTGTGENRGDWHYPIASMSNGKPVVNKEGLMAAYKRAAQQGDTAVLRKLPGKFRKAGIPVPEGLKGAKMKLEASINEDGKKFSARMVDEDNEILAEKEILVVNNNLEVEKVTENNKTKQETKAVATPVVEQTPPAVTTPAAETPAVVTPAAAPTTTATVSVPATTPIADITSPHVHLEATPSAPMMKEGFTGVPIEEFEQLKATAARVTDLESKIQSIIAKNEELEQFKIESQIQDLMRNYPPALWDGEVEVKKTVDGKEVVEKVPKKKLLYEEMAKDPKGFLLKYEGDRIKFAAANQAGKLAGSAASTAETEETLRNRQRRENLNGFFMRTGGMRK